MYFDFAVALPPHPLQSLWRADKLVIRLWIIFSVGEGYAHAFEQDIQLMVEEGLSAAEVLLPKTRPARIEQLSLLDLL